MRKLAISCGVAAAMLLAGGGAWQAEALTWNSAGANLPGVAKNYSPIGQIACRGWGRCPPGFRYKCRPGPRLPLHGLLVGRRRGLGALEQEAARTGRLALGK
jgi:hypothetical protein